MMTTQSDSTDNTDTTQEESSPKLESTESSSSFAKLFSYSLLGFFCIQVVLGTVVIILLIGKEMSRMQEDNVRRELEGRSQRLVSYLDTRLLILSDYAAMPPIITGVMQPGGNLANTVDFIEALPLLKSDVQFKLQNFQGDPVYSMWTGGGPDTSQTFQALMDGRQNKGVEIVTRTSDGEETHYWKLSVPVVYQKHREGVLSAYFPINLREIFPEAGDTVRIALMANDKPIVAMGEVPEPTIALDSAMGYQDIHLQQAVSEQAVNERITYLIYMMLGALVLGTGVVLLFVKRMGQKLLLIPHKRLEEMRDELEQEVERQTADLKMRTVQLSIEIRERREAETEAKETGNLVSALLEGIGAAFIIVNPETNRIVRSNSAVQDLFGLAPWQLSDRQCSELFSEVSAESMTPISCPDSSKKNQYVEAVVQHADGTKFPIARYLVPMEVRGQKHVGVIMLDITERKNLERRLNTAQKLESVGELASGIAHEINTPIQYVGDSIRFIEEAVTDIFEIMNTKSELAARCREQGHHADLTKRIAELEDDADIDFVKEEIPKACRRALEGTERVAVIVRAMKNFAHPGTGDKTMVDINQALENTIMVSKNEWKYVADIEKDFDALPMVKCLPGDINQVLLNILVNAAHAIAGVVGNTGEKGTITLATRASDDEVTIKVKDTGTGIPEEIREKIFDPFFTTKEVGRGTGQGLAIVHDIVVERHGGSIDIETEVGSGTTFIVTLPIKKAQ